MGGSSDKTRVRVGDLSLLSVARQFDIRFFYGFEFFVQSGVTHATLAGVSPVFCGFWGMAS